MLDVCKLFLLFVIISTIGWVIEELYALIRNHEKVNRGFLVGPLCPIYGICGMAFLLLDRFKDNIFVLFILSLLFVSVIEYLISFILEKALNIKLWDYERMNFKYQIRGRIALATLIPFGILGVLVTKYINPFIYSVLDSIDVNNIYIITLFIFIIFVIDFIFSVTILKALGKKEEFKYIDVTKYKSNEANKIIKDQVSKTIKKH